MKTEKRLTMALSVLVALMMLAVPLASSSNLFVDGGQTNSNGDAPLLGADAPGEGYTITLLLNGNENSLDKATYTALENPGKWYLDEDGNLYTVVNKGSTLSTVFADLYGDVDNSSNIIKTGYDLDSWKDEATGAVYGSDAAVDTTEITSNMTFSAQWLLNDNYCEIPVIVDYKGEQKEYVKAYPYLDGSDDKKITIADDDSLLTSGVPDLDTYGIVVNATITEEVGGKKVTTIGALSKPVYSFKATYGDNKEFEFTDNSATISADSKITIKYTFDKDNYSEIVVSSIAFKDGKDVTLYADRNRVYTYPQVYTALTTNVHDGTNAHVIKAAITIDLTQDKVITTEGYELTGWNEGAEPLSSEKEASSPLTLDAKLNGYYVIFMSKGQFEYVYVPFGELKADKTTLNIDGVNHWVWMKYSDYEDGTFTTNAGTINSFNFASTQNINTVEGEANGKTPAAVLIACFTPSSSTSYAVFDASSYTYGSTATEAEYAAGEATPASSTKGTFGNEYVQYLIIPGKVGDKISVPSIAPVYDEELKMLFISWNKFPATVARENTGTAEAPEYKYWPIESSYSEKDTYGNKNIVTQYAANAIDYKYTITFYDGDKVVGIFYYSAAVTTDINSALVAFEVDGKAYEYPIANGDAAAEKAYDSIITPDKAGYYITQWNDADKNKAITIENGAVTKVDIKDMKDDLNLYAQFEPESYVIKYLNTYTGSSSTQDAKVDQTVTLYTGATFVYNGYKLVGWSDRPDGDGTKYDLGASFTLSGEQYEDLKGEILVMYAVWEKSGSTPGDNTDGGDNNTDTYLLAGILAVIIILILLIAFLMRRKN